MTTDTLTTTTHWPEEVASELRALAKSDVGAGMLYVTDNIRAGLEETARHLDSSRLSAARQTLYRLRAWVADHRDTTYPNSTTDPAQDVVAVAINRVEALYGDRLPICKDETVQA